MKEELRKQGIDGAELYASARSGETSDLT